MTFVAFASRTGAPWLALVIILVVAGAVYRGVVGHEFLLDDTHTVVRNPAVTSLTHVGEWFSSAHATSAVREYANYRPVLIASYALDHALWGPSPGGFHATNLAIHLGVVALVFLLGRRLAGDALAALCAAGLFALHPINAEAVNYVAARSSSLTALSVLAAIWALEKGDGGGGRAWRLLAYALGAAALGTKEAAVVLPVLVVVWRRAAHGEETWSYTIRRSTPWWLLTVGYLGLRVWILASLVKPALSGPGVSTGQNTLFALKIYTTSVQYWLWPSGLAVDHAWPMRIVGVEPFVILGVLAAALVGTFALSRWEARWGWCAAWFWVAILPAGALGFLSRLVLYQDNRVYLSGVGLAWVGGHALAAGLRWSWPRPAARAVAALGVLVVLGAAVKADAARSAVWSNRAALWEDVLNKYPESLMAHNGKGMVAFESNRLEEARDWFERTVRLAPGFAEGHKNLGVTFARLGQWDRAVAALESALSVDPGNHDALINLGKVYEHARRPDLALEAYEQVLRDDPGHMALLARTARVLAQTGRGPEAIDRYREVVATGRADGETLMGFGIVLLGLEQWEEAERIFLALAARDPASAAVRFNLGTASEGQGQWERAAEHYRHAAALTRSDPDPMFRIGVLLSKQGRWKEAAAAYQEALARDPGHAPTHLNLGLLAERIGERAIAIRHYEAVLQAPAEGPGEDALRARARAAMAELSASGG